jgi:choline dehydrogenase-like flavoprotein
MHERNDAEHGELREALHVFRMPQRVVEVFEEEREPDRDLELGPEVVVEQDGQIETFVGDIVVVACGAANTAKLLLASANDHHPNGLANGSDQVGRNYMFHDSLAVLALSREENPTVFQKTLGLNDFYFGSDDFEYPLGNIQMVGKSTAQMYRGEKPGQTRLAPEWTLERVGKHAIDFWLSTEDLPSAENRVTLAPDLAERREVAHVRLA